MSLFKKINRKLWWLAVPLVAGLSFLVYSQVTAPALPNPVNLSTTPLYSSGTRDKPTLSLALSVEFPTVGAQYLNSDYAPTAEYLGYFDSESCYTYNNNADESLRRFDRTGAATNRTCGGTGFSGNFMNWASSSAIDVLRLGLTGGDRIVDTDTLTVLQRAVLPQQGSFWNSSNFPSKAVSGDIAAGAIPNNLRQGYTGTVYVANCLNRIHFGTAAVGDCNNPGNNTVLGTPIPSGLHSSFTDCAGENGTCSFSGTREIAYGADTRFFFKTITSNNGYGCNNNNFGDPASGTVKRCFIRSSPNTNPQFASGTQYGGPVLTSNNFFYSRVRVCEAAASGGALADPRAFDLADKQRALCLKYPNNNYKPVGQLQKNSDNLRVAAFGYLMDNRQERYGGVLRAPMKYVGGKTYDSTGNLINGTNPNVEWNENTGVFVANPQSATEGKSGVVNYLNQFGRTGGTQGTYKTYDPVGELYYEAVRYVQGLAPTPQAYSDATDDMKDGFPIYTTWTDPHAGGSSSQNYSCVRNNILVIGDVNTHNDKSIPGNATRSAAPEFLRTPSIADNEPNFHEWTKVIGAFESSRAYSYVDGKGVSRTTTNANPTPYNPDRWGMETQNIGATNAAYYIAGIAYWANTHDIRGTDWNQAAKRRPGMRITTYALDVNEGNAQSNVNTRRKANQFFFAAKYGGFDDVTDTGNPYIDKNGALDNSNWQRQTDPGEANNYFLSSNARAVLLSLDNIFEAIAKKGNSIAGGAISSKSLVSTNNIYQAQFDPAAWNGDITAIPVTVDSSGTVSIGASPQWSAAAQLDLKDFTTRNIVVGKTTATAVATALPFTWTTIDADLKASLNRPNPATAADARGEARLNYLRGNRTLETTTTESTLRRRASRLGDVINSGVVMSSTPTTSINSTTYQTFYDTNKSRTATLFVGANDGMLHAFNASNGNEIFAYIPSWMGPKLSALTNDTYITNHQSYVDATPVVAEAEVGSTWKTVLVGGTGAGGQGVYALDVTNPGSFDSSKVMWEFTDRDDTSMGNVVGQPEIRKVRISAPGDPEVFKWFAIVASGVNNYVADGFASTTANPAIFMLDLSKAAGTAWTAGVNYYKISFPLNSAVATRPPGIINFNVNVGLNGDSRYLYAGDLHGQLWKLDFYKVAASAANWTVANLSSFSSTTGPLPFFVAKDAAGVPQPITSAPFLARGPGNSTIVNIGTGKYLEATDNNVDSTTQVQSMYTLYDTGATSNDTTPAGSGSISGRGRLKAGSVNSAGVVTVGAFTYGRPATDTDTTKRAGWYFDFSTAGERQISTGETIGKQLVFGTVVPPSSATQICGTGSGVQYVTNLLSGSGSSYVSEVGLLGPAIIFASGARTEVGRDSTGRIIYSRQSSAISIGSSGQSLLRPTLPPTSPIAGRQSWRQISNYQELRNTP
ncbi:MAG: pilus assembly protein PilY [Comamonadaceae bacterium]|nr:MAG: pilus assembly protein PilY [Comamonadaceae bacterium]